MRNLNKSTDTNDLAPIQKLFLKDGANALDNLTEKERLTIQYLWRVWARPNQLLPGGDWSGALWMCGRGFGKTRTGAEAVRHMVETGQAGNILISSSTAADIREIAVEGSGSGIMDISPPWFYPTYEPTKRRITWPNGARAILVPASEPERFRGLQHDFFWADEAAHWRYMESWDQAMLGLRLGSNPRWIVTTTPRPTAFIKDLVSRDGKDVKVIRGTSFDNKANLAPTFFESIISRYKDTSIGKQEIYAEILSTTDGSIVSHEMLDNSRVQSEDLPQMQRVVVAVDPAVTVTGDHTGIVVCGLGVDGEVYVLDDQSCQMSPRDWARRVVNTYRKWEADKVIGESNMGGDLVWTTIQTVDPNIPFKSVRATRGKHLRFEPVGSLFEQGKIHLVGSLPMLEDQLVHFTRDGYSGSGSPDSADALVYGIYELTLDNSPMVKVWSL